MEPKIETPKNGAAKAAPADGAQAAPKRAMAADAEFAKHQNVVAAPIRPQDYEVVEEMPSALARGLVYIIGGFCLSALLWASVGRVDVVVEAKAAVAPLGESLKVQSEFGGMVAEIYVREGSEVSKGDPVFRLESLERSSKMLQSQMEVENIRSQLGLLKTEAETYEQLVRRGVIARLEYINKQKDYESAKRKLVQLESDLQVASANKDKMVVRSPGNGKVAFMQIHNRGQMAAGGEVLATIVPKGSPLVVELQVTNKDIAKLKLGQTCRYSMDAFPYQDYGFLSGKVVFISADALQDRAGNRYYVVRGSFDEPAYVLDGARFPIFAGLTGTVQIVTRRRSVLSFLIEPFSKMKKGLSIDA